MTIAVIVLIVAASGFVAGVAVGRLPSTPTFYQASTRLPTAVVLERVRDRRADLRAMRGRP